MLGVSVCMQELSSYNCIKGAAMEQICQNLRLFSFQSRNFNTAGDIPTRLQRAKINHWIKMSLCVTFNQLHKRRGKETFQNIIMYRQIMPKGLLWNILPHFFFFPLFYWPFIIDRNSFRQMETGRKFLCRVHTLCYRVVVVFIFILIIILTKYPLETWKYQFSYDHWSQAMLSLVSTWMGDCSSVAWVLRLTLTVG